MSTERPCADDHLMWCAELLSGALIDVCKRYETATQRGNDADSRSFHPASITTPLRSIRIRPRSLLKDTIYNPKLKCFLGCKTKTNERWSRGSHNLTRHEVVALQCPFYSNNQSIKKTITLLRKAFLPKRCIPTSFASSGLLQCC